MDFLLFIIVSCAIIYVIKFLWLWFVVEINIRVFKIKANSLMIALSIVLTKITIEQWLKENNKD